MLQHCSGIALESRCLMHTEGQMCTVEVEYYGSHRGSFFGTEIKLNPQISSSCSADFRFVLTCDDDDLDLWTFQLKTYYASSQILYSKMSLCGPRKY